MWKRTKAKVLRQSGQEYVSIKSKKVVGAKYVRNTKDCTKCKYNCIAKISTEERHKINDMFWSLDDAAKGHFYSEFTTRQEKERCRAVTNTKPKVFTNKYFLRSGSSTVKEQVCNTFFLNTLAISQMRISYFYEKMRCVETGVSIAPKSGKNPKNVIEESRLELVRAHIDSFPRIPSHYCRETTKKEYLEKSLNLTKMYGLYQDWCTESDVQPVKQHKYTENFYNDFDIGFQAPKKDRCNRCELAKDKENINPDERKALEEHMAGKTKARNEREKDRNDKTKAVLCFDLENVFSLPISGVSNIFYKRKLCAFNMTATLSLQGAKKSYFGIWHEGIGGRGGNNMASAIVKILGQVLTDYPDIEELTMWSDSCVCQNRNSIMTLALSMFIKEHPTLKHIVQKFCEAGHSNIQEVDSVHSVIERHLRHQEIYSPLGLIRKLKDIQKSQTMQIMEFSDYQKKAKRDFCFTRVPFTRVRQLKIGKALGVISYKLDHESVWTIVSVRREPMSTRKGSSKNSARKPKETQINTLPKPSLSLEKKKDLVSMLPYMPENDRKFMSSILFHNPFH